MQKPKWGEERSSAPRRGRWSAEEIARFRELYGLKDEALIARELNRSVASVRNMAQTVFEREPRTGPWAAAEVKELKRFLGASSLDTIVRILGRRREEVQAQIAELARIKQTSPWSAEDVNDFKRLYGTRTDEDLAIIFGRRIDEIQKRAKGLCISKDKAFLRRRDGSKDATKMPRWSLTELELLRELYPDRSNLEIAQRLNRSVKSVVSKAHNMGLKKDPSRLREMGRQNVSLRYRNKREG